MAFFVLILNYRSKTNPLREFRMRNPVFALLVILTLGTINACGVESVSPPDASVDAPTTVNSEVDDYAIWRTFNHELDLYTATHNMPRNWHSWVWWRSLSGTGQDYRQNRFYKGFVMARRTNPESRIVKILFKYEAGREDYYEPPFKGNTFEEREREHFRSIDELLKLVFTDRWTFQLFSKGLGNEITEDEADVVVFLGYTDGPASFIQDKYIYLIQDGTIAHELLHWFWFWHHYCQWPETEEQAEACDEHPPGEGGDLMNRRGGRLGPVELNIMGVEYSETDASAREEKFSLLQQELQSHNPHAVDDFETEEQLAERYRELSGVNKTISVLEVASDPMIILHQ